MLLDDINYNVAESGFDSTILEMDINYVLVDHEKPVLCDNYIVKFVRDATENYYEPATALENTIGRIRR